MCLRRRRPRLPRACGTAASARILMAMAVMVWRVDGAPPPQQEAGQQSTTGGAMQGMDMPATEHSAWHLMQDGNLFLMLDAQGGPRGATEVRMPNWWMGMARHPLGPGSAVIAGMFSLDPATVGRHGYPELFQAGETYRGRPLIDWQHPHDLTSQLSVSWRVPISAGTGLTIAGGPVGEPALGPVAFMHRPSATDDPAAPLTHHVFDSTHISMGVLTVAADHGPLVLEASVFNGREPNENRWNFMDRGRLDSLAARIWYRPSASWLLQLSTGHLVSPEALHPGNIWRTTATGSWMKKTEGGGFLAFSGGYGRNDRTGAAQNAVYAEATRQLARYSVYTRIEALQAETDVLLSGPAASAGGSTSGLPFVVALTGGGVRRSGGWRGVAIGVGADVTAYRVPSALQPAYGSHPFSFHLFLQVRPPASAMGRMWNMTMTHLLEARDEGSSMPGMPMSHQ